MEIGGIQQVHERERKSKHGGLSSNSNDKSVHFASNRTDKKNFEWLPVQEMKEIVSG